MHIWIRQHSTVKSFLRRSLHVSQIGTKLCCWIFLKALCRHLRQHHRKHIKLFSNLLWICLEWWKTIDLLLQMVNLKMFLLFYIAEVVICCIYCQCPFLVFGYIQYITVSLQNRSGRPIFYPFLNSFISFTNYNLIMNWPTIRVRFKRSGGQRGGQTNRGNGNKQRSPSVHDDDGFRAADVWQQTDRTNK